MRIVFLFLMSCCQECSTLIIRIIKQLEIVVTCVIKYRTWLTLFSSHKTIIQQTGQCIELKKKIAYGLNSITLTMNKLSWECHTRNPSWVGQIKMFFTLVEDKMSKYWDPSLPNIQGVPKRMRLGFCIISWQPMIGFSNCFLLLKTEIHTHILNTEPFLCDF